MPSFTEVTHTYSIAGPQNYHTYGYFINIKMYTQVVNLCFKQLEIGKICGHAKTLTKP